MQGGFRACLAEFIGTLTLIFIGTGAVCLEASKGGVGLVGIAFAHGFAILVMVAAVGHISGGHFNPAVTLGAWIAKKISASLAVAYIFAQLLGATVASFFIKSIYPTLVSAPSWLGTPTLANNISLTQGLMIEAIMTFFIVFVIFGAAIDSKGSKMGGIAIGLAVTMDILMGGPLTGAAMNPARAFGPAFVSGFWEHNSIYWIGPCLGAVLAALVWRFFYLKDED